MVVSYMPVDLKNIKHVALDMDGTIYLSNTLFPFTLDFLESLTQMGITYSFLTNNPSKSIDDYMSKLFKMGIPASREQMYTTTIATIDYIKEHYPQAKKLFLLGTPSMISQFENEGFISFEPDGIPIENDKPDLVVASFDMTLNYERLCRAAWWISQGLPYLATNPDKVCPTDQKTILVDCGSICACLNTATGRTPDHTLGKPDPSMLDGICHRLNLRPDQIAMVGDRLYTDIAMARNAGALGVLVLSGESTLQDVKSALEASKPDLVVENIAELGELLRKSRI